MICKNCNGEIRPSDERCPRCGTIPQWEGGNGFWDMARELRPAPMIQVAENDGTEKKTAVPTVEKAEEESGRSKEKRLRLVLRCLLALSAALLLTIFVQEVKTRRLETEVRELRDQIGEIKNENETPPVIRNDGQRQSEEQAQKPDEEEKNYD